MAQSSDIRLKNPCHLKWTDLEGNGNEKHCSTCATTVVDFSKMSNQEIVNFLNTKTEKVCGNISQSQLHSVIYQKQKSNLFFKPLLWLALGLSIPLTAQTNSPAPLSKQHSSITPNITSQKGRMLGVSMTKQVIDSNIIIKGTVLDSYDGLPLPQVSICIHGTRKSTITNRYGEFQFSLNKDKHTKRSLTLEIRYLGYITQKLKVKTHPYKKLKVFLVPDTMELGEVVITRRGIWSRVKSLFKRKNKRKKEKRAKKK